MSFSKEQWYEIEKMADEKASALSHLLSDAIKEVMVLEEKNVGPNLHEMLIKRIYWIKESLQSIDSIRKKCERQRVKK